MVDKPFICSLKHSATLSTGGTWLGVIETGEMSLHFVKVQQHLRTAELAKWTFLTENRND